MLQVRKIIKFILVSGFLVLIGFSLAMQRYWSEYNLFKQLGGKITSSFPIVQDYNASSGISSGHYFHQDLLVASMINKASPTRHIDIGSRVDGFIAHVASFRKIEVIDIPLINENVLQAA